MRQIRLLPSRRKLHILWGVLSVCLFVGGLTAGWFVNEKIFHANRPEVQGEQVEKTFPLLRYSFASLMNRKSIASPLQIERLVANTKDVNTYVFSYRSEDRKITGMLNVPTQPPASSSGYPVLVMLRGYVPPEEYQIGKGTQHVATKYAEKGYVTIAPDFLGHGESDPEPATALFEGRFVKPINVMDLLESIDQLSGKQISFNNKPAVVLDANRLGMWGHSNGGQIAVSVLEITGKTIPTTLWAPVTKQFPYSVLFFTDEYEDQGKGLRAAIAEFEKDYDIAEFTIGTHADRINAKMLLHQGSIDDAVPQNWSDDFYSLLVGKGKKEQIQYFVYPNTDHGLYPNIDQVVERDLAFFDKELGVTRGFAELLR